MIFLDVSTLQALVGKVVIVLPNVACHQCHVLLVSSAMCLL